MCVMSFKPGPQAYGTTERQIWATFFCTHGSGSLLRWTHYWTQLRSTGAGLRSDLQASEPLQRTTAFREGETKEGPTHWEHPPIRSRPKELLSANPKLYIQGTSWYLDTVTPATPPRTLLSQALDHSWSIYQARGERGQACWQARKVFNWRYQAGLVPWPTVSQAIQPLGSH